ncbi:dihydrofolate reductase [uncultured Bacteroides sp.]|uniref:dihydrofolate reductase family protein n=1 Tax=uncultured Bacteroides sp. TaxID=162156 RepID=UPI002AA64B56|nr:dihydrofolate reductase [uncultured Bacteroides sp.]
METIIYVAISANGQVLLASEGNYQTPIDLLIDSLALAHQIGNMVIGRKTFELFINSPGAKESLQGIELAVISQNKEQIEGVTFLKDIESVIEHFKKIGHTKIFVAGGALTYQNFINRGYVDEFYLNYVPVMTKNGVPLIDGIKADINLTLIESRTISFDILQAHYKVTKI